MTNAELMRQMTDEELAIFLIENCGCTLEKICDCDCVECWVSWLREEVEEDG